MEQERSQWNVQKAANEAEMTRLKNIVLEKNLVAVRLSEEKEKI